jgi:hypothetical protein
MAARGFARAFARSRRTRAPTRIGCERSRRRRASESGADAPDGAAPRSAAGPISRSSP